MTSVWRLGTAIVLLLIQTPARAGGLTDAFFIEQVVAREMAVLHGTRPVLVHLNHALRELNVLGPSQLARYWKAADPLPRNVVIEVESSFRVARPKALFFVDSVQAPGFYNVALEQHLMRRIEALQLPATWRGNPRVAQHEFHSIPIENGRVDLGGLSTLRTAGVNTQGGHAVAIELEHLSESQIAAVVREIQGALDTLMNEGIDGLTQLH